MYKLNFEYVILFQIGTEYSAENLQQWFPSQFPTECQTQPLYIPHGTKIYSSVSCVNTVEIEAIEHSGSYMVSYEPPDVAGASVKFAVNSVLLQDQSQVQRYKSTLHFFWDFFHDVSGMRSYQCRVTTGNTVVSEWIDVGQHNFVEISGIDMSDGKEYTAEVKGTNVGGLESDAISAKISINGILPVLTGTYFYKNTKPRLLIL